MVKPKQTAKKKGTLGQRRAPTAKSKAAPGSRSAKARVPRPKKQASQRPSRTSPVSPAKAKTVSLGRPKVTGEEKLFLLFREDYHARQIFDFLRVETVKDLEAFSPQEIVRRLSQPITQTVERIRQKLAEKNRCLRDDQQYAWDHRPAAGD